LFHVALPWISLHPAVSRQCTARALAFFCTMLHCIGSLLHRVVFWHCTAHAVSFCTALHCLELLNGHRARSSECTACALPFIPRYTAFVLLLHRVGFWQCTACALPFLPRYTAFVLFLHRARSWQCTALALPFCTTLNRLGSLFASHWVLAVHRSCSVFFTTLHCIGYVFAPHWS
jgi:hypothetical protein